jgi:predicted enzyme related to lactoylglutathione lyase
MLNLNSIMLGTMKPKEMAEFYEKVFDKSADWNDGDWYGWQVGSTHFTLGEHSEMGGKAKDPGRVMFNLETKDVEGEFKRIKKVGAQVIKEPYSPGMDMLIATFADPDGNYFQLMSPWEEQK